MDLRTTTEPIAFPWTKPTLARAARTISTPVGIALWLAAGAAAFFGGLELAAALDSIVAALFPEVTR